MIAQTKMFLCYTKAEQPVLAEILPVSKPFQVGTRFAEELTFHLFEFTCTESEIAWSNLVAECFTYLTYTKRQFFTCCACYIGEVDENALSSFRTEIADRTAVFCDTDGCFEHKIEFADRCKIMFATYRTDDILMICNKGIHLVKTHGINVHFRVKITDQFVSTMACFTGFAVKKRIRET